MGLATSKAGSRDRAIENAMRLLDNQVAGRVQSLDKKSWSELCFQDVEVVPMQRRWRDRNHPELVLCVGRNRGRYDLG